VIGRIVAHEMSLKDKEELRNKSSGAYKASCEAPTSSSEKQNFNEELSLMVKNYNKFYKSRSKNRSFKSRSYNDKRSSSRERNCYSCGRPGHYSNECTAPYKRREDSPKRRSKESPPRERRSRDDRYERRYSWRSKDSERKEKSQGATQNEDIKLMLVNGYPAPTLTATPREVITPTPKILKMKVLPV